ncbi:bactofilin family protein [Vibrio palustris]|uniref:Polymer-forming cytoskeletal n=1 Tax=Vibrio palustris TaxID=1918946 RepID=A0A1R4B643_9VIBR|nr:polymer-forming cytoskeletal protein [Vibrio palustris]SJL84341.1 Polymer-forming cytoskeletal [Vibrio palustris]
MQVDGDIDGHTHVDKKLVISETGCVKGDVYAEHFIVNGEFDGTCYADKVEILAKGDVTGTIYSDDLSIEAGGRFNGSTAPAPEKQVVELSDIKETKTSAERQKVQQSSSK